MPWPPPVTNAVRPSNRLMARILAPRASYSSVWGRCTVASSYVASLVEAAGRVDEVEHTGLEGLRLDECQRDRCIALVEQPHPVAHGDRVHQQVQLVEQSGSQQLADDRHRSADADVGFAGLALQPGHGLDKVTVELFGVAPLELQLLVRGHDLAGVAELLGERCVLAAGGFPLGPRPGEAVVGLAAEQNRVGGAEGGVDGSTHLVVEVGEVPKVRILDDAVERNEQACGDLPHDVLRGPCEPALCRPIRTFNERRERKSTVRSPHRSVWCWKTGTRHSDSSKHSDRGSRNQLGAGGAGRADRVRG